MRAKSCARCGQPQVFVRQCIFCGNTETDFWGDVEHQEAAELVRNGQFEVASDLADSYVQRHPDEAEGYFLRLLARRKCASAEYLLWKGFCVEDTDFHSALLLTEGETHEALVGIEAWMQSISQRLISAEDRYLASFQESLCLLDEGQRLLGIGPKERSELYDLYKQIEDAEGTIYQAAKRCRDALLQAEQHLAEARKSAKYVFQDTHDRNRMSKAYFDTWKAQVADVVKAAKAAAAEYNSAKERYAKEISWPSRRRKELSIRITRRLKAWSEEGGKARELLQKLEYETEQVNARKAEIQAGLFSSAAEQLGETAFFQALEEAGLKALPENVSALYDDN